MQPHFCQIEQFPGNVIAKLDLQQITTLIENYHDDEVWEIQFS